MPSRMASIFSVNFAMTAICLLLLQQAHSSLSLVRPRRDQLPPRNGELKPGFNISREALPLRIRYYSKKWSRREAGFVAYFQAGDLPKSDRTAILSNIWRPPKHPNPKPGAAPTPRS